MAPLIIAAKLESLRSSLARIEARVPANAEELAANEDVQESVILNLARAIQNCIDVGSHLLSRTDHPVPGTARDIFTALAELSVIEDETSSRLANATAFRNLAIHRYDSIDWAVVHRVCTESTADLHRFAAEIEQWLDHNPG